MAEVFVEFDTPIKAPDGIVYRAQACGAPMDDGTSRWEGWIEFLPVEGGDILRSHRETTQPNRADTAYWASGLSPVYLSGTLDRTLEPAAAVPAARRTKAPAFDGPAPTDAAPEPAPAAVLNPFSVYRKGEALLRSQLGALSAWHLANIARAHNLTDLDTGALERADPADLIELIVAGVRLRAAG
jgi:hypothetical protein